MLQLNFMNTDRLTRYLAGILALSLFALAFSPPSGDPGDCPQPSDFNVSGISDTSASLSWLSAPDINTVDIEIRRTGAADWARIAGATSPYTFDTLAACTLYDIRVQGICETDSSTFSTMIRIETDSCCRAPSSVGATSPDQNTLSVSWDNVASADSFRVEYKLRTARDWKELLVGQNSALLRDLDTCSAYDIRVQSICETADTSQFSSTIGLTGGCSTCTEAEYCDSRAYDASKFWIDSISFGNLFMKTGSNGGYLAYTTQRLILERGREYRLSVKPAFARDTCPLQIRGWLDLDLDGTFNDSTDFILDAVSMDGRGVTTSVDLADTLDLDITRLRLTLAPWDPEDTIGVLPCDTFNFGEVEDYCVTIDDVCPRAENLDTVSVSETNAVITWDVNRKAIGFLYQYRELGESEWNEPMLTMDTIVQVGDLSRCSTYEFRLIQVCIQDTVEQILVFDTKCINATVDPSGLFAGHLVYPNPFSRDITLELRTDKAFDGQILVASLDGRVVHQQSLSIPAGITWTEPLQALAEQGPGIYFLVITDGVQTATSKLVKVE